MKDFLVRNIYRKKGLVLFGRRLASLFEAGEHEMFLTEEQASSQKVQRLVRLGRLELIDLRSTPPTEPVVVETPTSVTPIEEPVDPNLEVSSTADPAEELRKLSYRELQSKCREAGLPTGGKAPDLIARLLEA